MNEQTITAMYESKAAAESARNDLVALGIPSASIMVRGADSETTTTTQVEEKGFWASLFLPDDDRETFAEGVRRGGYLLTANVAEHMLDQAHNVLERSDAVDLDSHAETWRKEGWTPGTTTTTTTTSEGAATGFAATGRTAAMPATSKGSMGVTDDQGTIKLVEEQLKVGKRNVERGGVKVRSYIVETPVEEQITLRDERVTLERRPVDRAAVAGELDAFKDQTIELTERDEEAVVSKDARVTEEIVLGKAVEDRTETISDKVRSTKVEVEDTRTGQVARSGVAGETVTSTTGTRPI